MALSPATAQYISQLGLITYVDPSGGPAGPQGTVAFKLVPTGGWHQGQRFPHVVETELKGSGFKKTKVEGVEYFLVPDESSNTPGLLSHYAQRTGVQDLQNPPGGGVNRALEVADSDNSVAPDAVRKYVKENDNWEEARKTQSEEDARVKRQVGAGE